MRTEEWGVGSREWGMGNRGERPYSPFPTPYSPLPTFRRRNEPRKSETQRFHPTHSCRWVERAVVGRRGLRRNATTKSVVSAGPGAPRGDLQRERRQRAEARG